jgi:hypothetical protein
MSQQTPHHIKGTLELNQKPGMKLEILDLDH